MTVFIICALNDNNFLILFTRNATSYELNQLELYQENLLVESSLHLREKSETFVPPSPYMYTGMFLFVFYTKHDLSYLASKLQSRQKSLNTYIIFTVFYILPPPLPPLQWCF